MITVNKANPTPGEVTSSLTGSTGDGAGLHLDGTAGKISFTPPDLGTKFSIEFVIKCDSFGSANQHFIDFGYAGRFILASRSDVDSYNLVINDHTSWTSLDVKILDDLKVHHLVLTVDGTSAKLYDNGNEVASKTISADHDIDDCVRANIGANEDGLSAFADATYYRTRFYNKALTSAEVQTAYERADVDYADQYGSQTSKILNGTAWTSASGSTPPTSWTAANSATYTIDSSSGSGSEPALKIQRSTDSNPYIYQTFSAVVGKQYRVKYRVKNVDATHVRVGIGSSAVGTQYNATDTTATSWQDFEQTYTATTSTFSVYVQVATSTGTQSGYIDSLVVEQVGCVSDYQTQWANPTQSLTVQDRAGAADGTCSASGVTQVNSVVQLNTEQLSVGGTNAKVGIGLAAGSNPQEMLHIDGISPRIRLRDSDASGTPISTIDASGGGILISADANDETTGSDIRLATDGTTHFTLDSSGNVTQNGAVLKVERDDNAPALQLYNNHASPADGAALGYVSFTGKDHDGTANQTYANIGGHCESNTASNVSGYLTFNTTKEGTATTERIRISSTGNVSMGSTSSVYGRLFVDASTSGNEQNTALAVRGRGSGADYLALNVMNNADGALFSVRNDGLATFTGGIKNEQGIYGGQITIADDAVGTITPPRQGVMMAISYSNNTDYPTHETYVGIFWCDTGASQNVTKITSQGGGITTHNGVDLTAVGESSSVDGHLNISTISGTIQLKNRISGSVSWWYNFIA